MRQMKTRLFGVLLASSLTVVAVASPAAADGGFNRGVKNHAAAVTSGAPTFRAEARVSVTSLIHGSATATNTSLAVAKDCTGCRSQAAAIQVVLTDGNLASGPVNVAVATNYQCTSCVVFSYARQFVVLTDSSYSLSATARAEVSRLSAAADAVIAQQSNNLSELERRLATIADDLRSVISADLTGSGRVAAISEIAPIVSS